MDIDFSVVVRFSIRHGISKFIEPERNLHHLQKFDEHVLSDVTISR